MHLPSLKLSYYMLLLWYSINSFIRQQKHAPKVEKKQLISNKAKLCNTVESIRNTTKVNCLNCGTFQIIVRGYRNDTNRNKRKKPFRLK